MPCHPWLCYDIIPFWSLAHLPHVGLLSSVDDCSSFFTSFSVCTCAHMHAHTHTQNSSAKQKPVHAISLLKTLEWLPKILKTKKKNPKFLPRSTRPCKTWPSPNSSSYYVPSRQISFLIHIHSTSISFLTSGSLHYLPSYESVSCSVVSGSLRPHWL